MNVVYMNQGVFDRFYCTACGRELSWSDKSGWECRCGERYEIITTGEVETREIDYREDVFIKAVLSVFDISWAELIGRGKCHHYIMAREIVADYLYNQKWLSLWRAGEVLGGRTNATIFHLCRLFERDFSNDRKFRGLLDTITKLADAKAK